MREKGVTVRGRRLKLLIVAVLAVSATATAGAALKATQGGTLVFGGSADPTYLDPALASDGETFRVTEQIFEGLVKLKPGTLKLIPWLATRWTTGKDGKTYTFQLRKGVKFHDGTPFNAKAVCANFDRWYNWTGPCQDASATVYYQTAFFGFKHNEVAGLSSPLYRSCKAKGSSTAVIKLTQKTGTFINWLVLQPFTMQSPTAMKKYGADQAELKNGTFSATGTYAFSHPTGTGPYKFVSWTVGQKVELAKNPSYWGTKAKLDRVIKRPPFNVGYVTINSAHVPFNNPKVRQAIAYGLDRRGVVQQFYYGTGTVANDFLPPALWGHSNKIQKYSYDPEKAKSLLREAGLTVPVKVEFWYPTNISRPYMPDPKRNFEAFKASLENSGFKVDEHSAPWRPDYVKKVNEGSAGDLNLIGWTGDFGDPDNFLGNFFKTYSPQFGWKNNMVFKTLQAAARETVQAKRAKLYAKASVLVSKAVPAVPYVNATPALGAQKSVQNLIATPVGGVWFGSTTVGGQ